MYLLQVIKGKCCLYLFDIFLQVSLFEDPHNRRSCVYSVVPAVSALFLILFFGAAFISPKYELKCKPDGSEALPEGIVAKTSNLQMRPLWGFPKSDNSSFSLFAIAAGIKQSDLVDKMVTKFLSSNFSVMLFHYDGVVDQWKTFEWCDRVIHVSAANQTKWWFAKRFLHPDIVAEYSYIFLWDEDLGVEDFNPQKYVSIVKSEGLEISQPALDPAKSEVHHQITARSQRSIVHRRTYKPGLCDKNSTAPPCTGWIEMMAPVFSRAAWRCVWYLIQNDLIHAWGLDMQLGYCAQGDRTKNVGVVDAEYVVHYGRPTLGVPEKKTSSHSHKKDPRLEVRRQSFLEFKIFKRRWIQAAKKDNCWIDPYSQSLK
ncbi:Lysine ketoglutarate reductase trans-splicing-like protein [Citrus sinensis]|nr:Lysine ketoglutarate reductase trans-splicing-like protein [Citrus sinensis]